MGNGGRCDDCTDKLQEGEVKIMENRMLETGSDRKTDDCLDNKLRTGGRSLKCLKQHHTERNY